jgi:hypothetical protein
LIGVVIKFNEILKLFAQTFISMLTLDINSLPRRLIPASGTKMSSHAILKFYWGAFEERDMKFFFLTLEFGSRLNERDRPGGAIVRDDLAAPESTKKVICFSLGPTIKFIKAPCRIHPHKRGSDAPILPQRP